MADGALKERQTPAIIGKPADPVVMRRFELPDLNEHGSWVIERLLEVYPAVAQMQIWTRLNAILYNNEFLFLYQKNAVGVAEVVRGNSIAPRPVIHVWFVFTRDRTDAKQIEEAAVMYADFARWAKAQSAEAVILTEHSDVQPETAVKHMGGRMFERKQLFVSVKA